jgi:uncharacterized membrane protein
MNFKNFSKSKKLAIYALSSAIVCVATILIKIPTVATDGYINFGDTFIFIFAIIFNPLCGLICGGLGSSLADIFSGYAVWAPYTLIIKGFEGYICGLIASKLFKKDISEKFKFLFSLFAVSIAGLFMVTGYCFANAIMKGSIATGIASIPENLIQAGVSILIALILLFSFKISRRILK